MSTDGERVLHGANIAVMMWPMLQMADAQKAAMMQTSGAMNKRGKARKRVCERSQGTLQAYAGDASPYAELRATIFAHFRINIKQQFEAWVKWAQTQKEEVTNGAIELEFAEGRL